MLSKLGINLSRRISESLDFQIHHNKSMEKEALTHRTRDIARRDNLKTTNPSCRKKRVM
jgi:hypothetical protein